MNDEFFGFVILHYLAFEMTCECVDLLHENFCGKNIHIAIVDNGSSNMSGKKLSEKYKDNPTVSVILNKTNLGFAQGNNVGYVYLKSKFDCDYIIVMNNDVLIEDKAFLEKITVIQKRTQFGVLGPDIFSPHGYRKHQNPFALHNFTSESDILARYQTLKSQYEHFDSWYRKSRLFERIKKSKILSGIYRFIKYGILKKERIDFKKEYVNPVLHGACYIFSRQFIEKRKNAFYPKTFLYFEEHILQYECVRGGIKMIYSPDISVCHLEDVSTNRFLENDFAKEKFKLGKMMDSALVFLDLVRSKNV